MDFFSIGSCEDDYSWYFPFVKLYYLGLLGPGMQIEHVSSDDVVATRTMATC